MSETQSPGADDTTPAPAKAAASADDQYAVYDETLEQYVSGVSSKADAEKGRKELSKAKRYADHKLVSRKLN